MKIKNLLLALLCCFFGFNALQAQDDFEDCNTPEPTQAQLDYHNLFEGLMFSFDLNAQPNVIYTIPITAHIARLDNGTGGLTAQQLDDAMLVVNDYYLNAKLQFSVCGINYIDDNNYYDYNIGDEYAMTTTHNVPNTINIYFVNGIQGGLYCGYTRIPPSSDVVLMANSCVTSGNTLSHELGHYFSLYHTHGKTNFGTTSELVDGTNCSMAGDDICDTPADPNLYGKVNGMCEYSNSETDANGMLYTPNVANIMSYAPKFCRNEFTLGQYERILFGYLNHRYYLTPDAGFATASNNLNATFTNTSMGDGVLSYTWDFGDGNTSTMQDPTNIYAEEGVYTVCLEVTDGCGIDMYCEDVNIIVIPTNNCLAADSLELVSFYNALGGDNWADNSGWLTAPVSDWYGITLTADGCGVKEISLNGTSSQDFGLVGNLIDLNLPNLTHLMLYYNQLDGNIPDFSNLPNLTNINLMGNQLDGNIPDFSNLTNLDAFSFSSNPLGSNIPDFSNLPNLTYLSISESQLIGEIPNFNHLPKLNTLFLNHNELSGNIPDFSNLPNLTKLYLNTNELSGNIPNFNDLPNLTQLYLRNNQLTFTGLENHIQNSNFNIFLYAPQANIPIYQNGNSLYVSAGGTLSNNTYTWFKNGIEIATIEADSTFTATEAGTYYCKISNDIVTNLVLQSDEIIIENNCNPPYTDFLGEDITTCDFPITIYANVPNMDFYVWNTGEGTENISISQAGTYSLAIIDECGNSGFDEVIVIDGGTDLVWPGDADNDGEVNNIDVLAIGLMHSETGMARDSIDITFEGKCANDWTDNLPNGANTKHTDCDGNGITENDDVQAILDNYGQTHPITDIMLDFTNIPLQISQTLSADPTNSNIYILEISANATVYGLAYTLDYGIGNYLGIDFSNSCLGTEGIDFVKVVKNDVNNHKLHIGISRTNRINVNCGSIAKITMEILDLPADYNSLIQIQDGIASLANDTYGLIIGDPNCVAPSILEEQNLTASGVTLAWNNTGAEAYQLGGRRVGGTATTFPETTATSRTFTSGLQSSTCYEWTVRAKCNGVWTDWYFPLASFCTGAGKNGEIYSEANDPFLTNENPSFANVVLYPNPAKETAFLALESGFENTIEVLVFDILGKKVRTQKENLQTGSNTLNINIDALETGIYFVEINDGFEKKVMKLNIF